MMAAPGGSAGASVVDRDVLGDGGDEVSEGEVFSGTAATSSPADFAFRCVHARESREIVRFH